MPPGRRRSAACCATRRWSGPPAGRARRPGAAQRRRAGRDPAAGGHRARRHHRRRGAPRRLGADDAVRRRVRGHRRARRAELARRAPAGPQRPARRHSGDRPAPALGGYPAVVRRVATAPRTGDMTDEYAFLARYARARTKFTMPAPSYHRRYWSPEHSPRGLRLGAEEYLTEIRDYLRSVVDKLVSLGCDYIQLDAPNYGSLLRPRHARGDAGRGPRPGRRSWRSTPSSTARCSTACRGHHGAARLPRQRPGGRLALGGRLRRDLRARCSRSWRSDRLLLEYDSDRAGGFEPLADVPDGHGRRARPAHHEVAELEYEADVLDAHQRGRAATSRSPSSRCPPSAASRRCRSPTRSRRTPSAPSSKWSSASPARSGPAKRPRRPVRPRRCRCWPGRRRSGPGRPRTGGGRGTAASSRCPGRRPPGRPRRRASPRGTPGG